jgi:signal transduction histidine kinase
MIRSVRGRIVLGSVAIATAVLALLGVIVFEQLRHIAGAAVVTLAQEELRPFAADLRNQPDEDPDAPGQGLAVLIVAPDGGAVINTLPAGLTTPVERAGTGVSRVHASGGSYVAVGEVVTNARGTWQLWALRSSDAATVILQGFAQVLLPVVVVVLILVALGSWLLVRAAFRPVDRLRTAADLMQQSGTPGRLPEGRGGDELTALAATLNRFLDTQRESVERERRMVADASHELRTPLAVLTMQLELPRADQPRELEAKIIAAQSQVRALSRLTTQLLELSQLESDSRDRRRGDSVDDLVSEAMAAIDRARAVATPGVQVEFEIDGEPGPTARTRLSAVAYGRIIDNLTSNALRATTRGEVSVRIASAPDQLVVTVEDSGSGVPVEFLPHAFERFSRSERSRAAGVEGSGLGLALVQALVQDAGGSVSLANREAGGAIATVQLPVHEGSWGD